MLTALVACLPAICGILVALLQLWSSKAPERKKEALDEAIQDVRNAVAAGDVATVNDAVNELLPVSETAPDGATRQHSDASIANDLHTLLNG